jgi:myo-inositol-1(or 4)-monophosphatase
MEDQLAFAKDLARWAGVLIKDGFENSLQIEMKPDNSPVTQVDTAINDLVIKTIQAKYPDHGVLGEEADSGTGCEEYQWLCDPLDGTIAFILGIPQSTFILGLTKAGDILLSVVYDPFTDRLFHAVRGHGAFCNGAPIQVNHQPLKGSYILAWKPTQEAYAALKARGAIMEVAAGAGYRCLLLASGRCTAIIQGSADHHDVGPSSLIVEEAGGTVTDMSGASLRYDQPLTNGIILSNGVDHGELVKLAQHSLK